MNQHIRASRAHAIKVVEQALELLGPLTAKDDPGYPYLPHDTAVNHLTELVSQLDELAHEPDPLPVHTYKTKSLYDHMRDEHGGAPDGLGFVKAQEFHDQDHASGDNIHVRHEHEGAMVHDHSRQHSGDESYWVDGCAITDGRCDTCGAPCDANGCTVDADHESERP